MTKLPLLLLIPAFGLAACVETTPTQNTILGGVAGAAAGAAVSSKGDRAQGAFTGAALGAVAGTLVGNTSKPNQCYYSDGRGGRYIAAC